MSTIDLKMAIRAADKLQGTHKSLVDLGPEFFPLRTNALFCAHLDSLLFVCDECERWQEIGYESINLPGICMDCE